MSNAASRQIGAKGEAIPSAKAAHDEIIRASLAIAHLAQFARWAGRGLAKAEGGEVKPSSLNAAGTMLIFLGEEIERHCAVIDEVTP